MKKVVIRIISMLLLICTLLLIFGFSAQNAEESGSLSNKVTTIFINHFPYTKDLSIDTKQKLIEHTEPIVRKLAHFSIYAVVRNVHYDFCLYIPIKFRDKTLYKFGSRSNLCYIR